MRQEILDYIASKRIGVLAIEMMDGSPHGATVHYAHAHNPLVFYFETYRHYRKAEPLFEREVSRASFVVGVDESDMKTLQMDGMVQLLKPEEQATFDQVYLGKFPEKKEKAADAKFVFFTFTPTWWRFTDWTTPEGKQIWSSQD